MKKKFIIIAVVFIFNGLKAWSTPAPVTDLSAAGPGFRHIDLSWTTPYDSSVSSSAIYYQVRVSTIAPIVAENDWINNSGNTNYPYIIEFASPTAVSGEQMRLTVTGLANNTACFFAIKTSTDEVNWSALDTSSPEPFATPFNTAPGNVGGHNLMYGVVVASTVPYLAWSQASCGSDDAAYGDSIISYTVELSTAVLFATKTVKDNIALNNCSAAGLSENTTYYWRVCAYDAEGLNSPGYYTLYDRRFVVNGIAEQPGAVSLVSPVSNEIIADPTPQFIWSAATDPDPGDVLSYELYYTTTSAFEINLTTHISNILIESYEPSQPLIENAKYFWKVFAADQSGLVSTEASTESCRINSANEAPQSFMLNAPAGGSTVIVSTPVFSWTPSSDLDPGDTFTYTITYSSTDALLTTDFSISANITTTYFVPPEPLAEDATYYFMVYAIDAQSWVSFTPIWSFYVNAVNIPPSAFGLISPSGVAGTSTPQLSWQPSTDPDGDEFSYTVLVSSSASFSFYYSSAGINNTQLVVPWNLTENQTYYWKVKVIDTFLNSTESTGIFMLIIDALEENPLNFSLINPVNFEHVSNLAPSLSWSATTDPDPFDQVGHYDLYYSSAADFSSQIIVPNLTENSATLASLENNTTYYWKVNAVSLVSGSKLSSSTEAFVAANLPPEVFSLIYSSGLITSMPLNLQWQAALDPESDSVSYTVLISSYQGFASYISSGGISAEQYSVNNLDENKTYYWKVRAYDIWSNEKESANTYEIIIDTLAQAPDIFALLSPADGERSLIRKPVFSWQIATDPDPNDTVSYIVSLSTSPDMTPSQTSSELAVNSYTFAADLECATTYWWKVTGVDKYHLTTETELRNVFINPALTPSIPQSVNIIYTGGTALDVSWSAVVENTNLTPIENLYGYRIYRANSVYDLLSSSYSALVSSSVLNWSDNNVSNQSIYYYTTAVNSFLIESAPSQILGFDGNIFKIYKSQDNEIFAQIPYEELASTSTISLERKLLEETPQVLRSFTLLRDQSGSSRFTNPVKISLRKSGTLAAAHLAPSQVSANYAIFWNNGVEWINLGACESVEEIFAQAPGAGNFELRAVSRAVKAGVLSTWPKLITPNADGINDQFNVTLENPDSERIDAKVYDLNYSYMAKFRETSAGTIVWDGKNDSGWAVNPGIYIYEIKAGDFSYSGSIVVAR